MIFFAVLEPIHHLHFLIADDLACENIKGKTGHFSSAKVEKHNAQDVDINSAVILSSRTEFEKIRTRFQRI